MSRKNIEDGYVYLVQLMIPNQNVYKIGHCSLSRSRLAEYTKLPYEIKYIGLWHTEKRKHYEQKLHDKFMNKRMNGEWFDLSRDDINEIKQIFKNDGIEEILYQNNKENTKKNVRPIQHIYPWEENKEPDGYDQLYVIRCRDWVFTEQDLGNVPFLYGGFRKNKNNHNIKRYPTLNLDEINIENQCVAYDNYQNSKIYMKIWGRNRHDCYKKLINRYKRELVDVELGVEYYRKRMIKDNEKFQGYIERIKKQLVDENLD